MAKIPISEAVKMVGVSQTTLYRDLKEGKMSYETDARGRKVIDTAELQRVYKDAYNRPENDVGNNGNSQRETIVNNGKSENGTKKEANSAVIAVLEEQVAMLKEQLENATTREQKLIDMLSAEQEKTRQLMLPPPDNDKPKSNFFRRIFNI